MPGAAASQAPSALPLRPKPRPGECHLRSGWRHPPPSAGEAGAARIPRALREGRGSLGAGAQADSPRSTLVAEGGSRAAPERRWPVAASPRSESSRDRSESVSPAHWLRLLLSSGGRAQPAYYTSSLLSIPQPPPPVPGESGWSQSRTEWGGETGDELSRRRTALRSAQPPRGLGGVRQVGDRLSLRVPATLETKAEEDQLPLSLPEARVTARVHTGGGPIDRLSTVSLYQLGLSRGLGFPIAESGGIRKNPPRSKPNLF